MQVIHEAGQNELCSILAELHRGNGYIVSELRERGQDFLALSNPDSADRLFLLIKPVQGKEPVSAEIVKNELVFLESAGEKYRCSQYCLIAPSGFEAAAKKYSRFNLLLQGEDDIAELRANYRVSNRQKPAIQLFAHNQQTYSNVKLLFRRHKAVAVVQATGTGKSYLIARLLQDYSGRRRVVLAPSWYILNQLKETIIWDKEICFLTYSKLMNLSDDEILELNPGFIVFDEYHRCGAEEWGRGVKSLLLLHPQARVFGTSATPVRYLDNARDMSEELFSRNVAENLNLAQAIVKRILPAPKYVSALYSLEQDTISIKEKIVRSLHGKDHKNSLLRQVDSFKIDWEKSSGIPSVLKKHLTPQIRKFIVFCREEDHLKEMIDIVAEWFKAAGYATPEIYRVLSSENKSEENLLRFKKAADKNRIHLLFSINMLNEGLHVDEVHGVILLRPTESPNIFYQQIGRCLKVGMGQSPVIFDFVNNFRTIRARDFLYELEFSRSEEARLRFEMGLEDRCPQFHIIDETRKITELFGDIEFQLDHWDLRISELKTYRERYGTCVIAKDCEPEFIRLRSWVMSQRIKQKHKKLEPERENILAELGVSWITMDLKRTNWDDCFEKLKRYKKQYGHCNVPQRDKKHHLLAVWVANQRDAFRNNYMKAERREKLDSLGFEWSLLYRYDVIWEKRFEELKEYKKIHGHCNIPVSWQPNKKLASWVCHQRKNSRIQRFITREKIEKLNSIGFVWDPGVANWEEQLQALIAFGKNHGHFNVPNTSSTSNPFRQLGAWVSAQRRLYKNGTLQHERKKTLLEIGFQWSPSDERWNEMYGRLAQFKKNYGHLKVTAVNDKVLYVWLGNLRKSMQKENFAPEKAAKLAQIGYEVNDYRRKKRQINA